MTLRRRFNGAKPYTEAWEFRCQTADIRRKTRKTTVGVNDVKVYERSYKAALAVYRVSKRFPKEETYGLASQIRRAATGIPLNIAEGYAKKESQQEFKRFIMMALGSSEEVQVLLRFAKDLGYIDEDIYKRSQTEYREISKMLNGLKRSI